MSLVKSNWQQARIIIEIRFISSRSKSDFGKHTQIST